MSTTITKQPPTRLVRFQEAGVPADGPVLWGQPVDADLDLGEALAAEPRQDIKMKIWARYDTTKKEVRIAKEVVTLGKVLNPLDRRREEIEAPTDALNENLLPEPFYKPHSPPRPHYRMPDLSLCPNAMTFSPAIREDEEMHLAIQLVVVEGKEAKNIAPEDALEYILGYTIAVTARIRKVGDQTDPGPGYDGIDAFCPLGPVVISPTQLPDPSELVVTITINGESQDGNLPIPTLQSVKETVASSSERGFWYPGAYAMIGTPAGLLRNKKPRICLRKGDEISFHGSHGVGSLVHTICQKRGRGSPKGGEGDKDLSLA